MALIHSSLPIVSDNLVLYLDAANPKSYSGTGATWSDMLGGNDITLTGGPSFDSTDGGGSIVLMVQMIKELMILLVLII